jgi:hypothetical protein
MGRQNFLNCMVAGIPQSYSVLNFCVNAKNLFLICLWLNYGFVTVILKCLNLATGSFHTKSNITELSFSHTVISFRYFYFTSRYPLGKVSQFQFLLNFGNACYRAVQNHLSSHLLSKNTNIKIYKTKILPVVLYGCETWFFTLREHRFRVFENGA